MIAAEAGRGPPCADGGSPSAFYVRAWNEIIGPKSERFRDLLSHFAREGLAWVAEHGARPGERVLDVGCGWGRSTRALARRVGPGGHVVGIDCTAAFIEVARREATEDGADNVSFVAGDAGCHPLPAGAFDVLASVEGTMFFAEPVPAFAHLRRALRPGGRLVMALPRDERANPWLSLPKRLVRAHLGLPPAGPTCGPGPFSLGDPFELTRVLTAAGFEDVRLTPHDEPALLGADVAAAIEMQMVLGPVGELVRLHALDEGGAASVRALLVEALAPHLGPMGVVLSAGSWLVQARSV